MKTNKGEQDNNERLLLTNFQLSIPLLKENGEFNRSKGISSFKYSTQWPNKAGVVIGYKVMKAT